MASGNERRRACGARREASTKRKGGNNREAVVAVRLPCHNTQEENKVKKKIYTARWWGTNSSVSFEARSDYEARLRAEKIRKELGHTRTPDISCEGRLI